MACRMDILLSQEDNDRTTELKEEREITPSLSVDKIFISFNKANWNSQKNLEVYCQPMKHLI